MLLAVAAGLLIVMTGRPLLAIGASLLLGAAWLVTSAALFASHSLWLPVAAPLSALVVTLTAGSLSSYVLEGRERRFLRRAFEHYLAPQVIETLVRDPSHLRLGGARCEITTFFSDLQGFTSFSERLAPAALVQLLNRYLSEMTEALLDRGGTLDLSLIHI